MPGPAPLPPPTDSPVYWFVRLSRAVERGELEAAITAQRELRRLGVTVRYERPSAPRREGDRRGD